jgi:hypothetical protein
VFKWDECEFPKDVDWRSLPPAVEENFKLFVTQIKQELLDSMKETRTLGYALKSVKKGMRRAVAFHALLLTTNSQRGQAQF